MDREESKRKVLAAAEPESEPNLEPEDPEKDPEEEELWARENVQIFCHYKRKFILIYALGDWKRATFASRQARMRAAAGS